MIANLFLIRYLSDKPTISSGKVNQQTFVGIMNQQQIFGWEWSQANNPKKSQLIKPSFLCAPALKHVRGCTYWIQRGKRFIRQFVLQSFGSILLFIFYQLSGTKGMRLPLSNTPQFQVWSSDRSKATGERASHPCHIKVVETKFQQQFHNKHIYLGMEIMSSLVEWYANLMWHVWQMRWCVIVDVDLSSCLALPKYLLPKCHLQPPSIYKGCRGLYKVER